MKQHKSPKRPWFKAKSYGWGWMPDTWQGWLIFAIWITVFAGLTATINLLLDFSWYAPLIAILLGFIWLLLLVWIAYRTGEKPHWQWGSDNTKSSSDDSKKKD